MATVVTPPAPIDGGLPPAPGKDPALARLEVDLARERDNNARLTSALNTRQVPQQPAPPAVQGPDQQLRDMNRRFYENPVGHSVTIAQEAARAVVGELAQAQHPTLVQAARAQVRATDPELFDKYAPEIEAKVASLQPQWHTNATVWQNAFTITKGERLNEIAAARAVAPDPNAPQAPALHLRDQGGPARPNTPAQPALSNKTKLTVQESEWARKFDMTDEAYARSRDRTFQQEAENPLNSMKKMSLFDGAVTFSSDQKRKDARDARRKAAARA
jgi:hypothetical protein